MSFVSASSHQALVYPFVLSDLRAYVIQCSPNSNSNILPSSIHVVCKGVDFESGTYVRLLLILIPTYVRYIHSQVTFQYTLYVHVFLNVQNDPQYTSQPTGHLSITARLLSHYSTFVHRRLSTTATFSGLRVDHCRQVLLCVCTYTCMIVHTVCVDDWLLSCFVQAGFV